jgi:phosphoserine phosphatase
MIIKGIFYDMDGTLTDFSHIPGMEHLFWQSSWTAIFILLSEYENRTEQLKAKNEQDKKMCLKETTNIRDWATMAVEEFVKGIKIEDHKVEPHIRFTKGTEETVQWLSAVFPSFIISGGVHFVTKLVARKLGVDNFLAIQLDTDNEGCIMAVKEHQIFNKVDMFNYFLNQYQLDESSVLFVGDDSNDIPIMERAGLSVAFRPRWLDPEHPKHDDLWDFRPDFTIYDMRMLRTIISGLV